MGLKTTMNILQKGTKMNRLVLILLAKVLLVSTVVAQEKVTLLLHHFMSPKSSTHIDMMTPWAKKVEKESKGRIEIKVFPAMTLGGKPPELYNQVRDGSADIIWTVTGYTPGVFPRSEVFALPSVHNGSAVATNQAIADSFDLIADDFKDVHPLLAQVHAGNVLHMVNKNITKVSDLKGLKLRSPSRTGVWFIEELGAEPVGMPFPSLPQALSKGAVDGALIPFEVLPPYKIQELTKYSISLENDVRLGSTVFVFAMNKKRYNSLPADLKKVIDNNSGKNIAKKFGEISMRVEEPGKKAQRNSKDSKVIELNKKISKQFEQAGNKVVDKWIQEVSKKGINGKKLVQEARKAIKKYE